MTTVQIMKRLGVVAIAFGMTLIQCLFALADDQAAQLPEDGWWIRYFTASKLEAFNGTVKEYTIKATYSLVGTVAEDGVKLRWVEVHSIFVADGKESVVLSKFLIAEKDLLESEQPLDKIKRGWLKSGAIDVRAVVAGKGINPYNTRTVVFPGMWQKAERIGNERILEYQQGKMAIPEARTLQVSTPVEVVGTPNAPNTINRKSLIEYTGWYHRTTLPLIAAAKIHTKTFYNDKLNTTQNEDIVMQEYGTGAKSRLPENN